MTIYKTIGDSPRAALLLTTAAFLLFHADGNLARGESASGGSGKAVQQSSPVNKPPALSGVEYNPAHPAAQPVTDTAVRDRLREKQKPVPEPQEKDPLDR